MATMAAEALIDANDFFKELNKGKRFIETTLDGRKINLRIHSPHVENILRASDLFDALDAGLDNEDTVRRRLMRLACRSCIDGVNGENVAAFLDAFPPMPRVVVACLRLLRVKDSDMRRVGIDPDILVESG